MHCLISPSSESLIAVSGIDIHIKDSANKTALDVVNEQQNQISLEIKKLIIGTDDFDVFILF